MSPLSLLKPVKALARLRSPPRGRNGSLEFSPLCLRIHGLFPSIELVVAPSSSLPNSGDPGATLARACSTPATSPPRRGAALLVLVQANK